MSEQHASPADDAQQSSTKPAGRKPGKSASKSARSRAREFALQALYQVIVGKNEQAVDLDKLILPLLDSSMAEIYPIERAAMWIGVFEMKHCLDVPWRVSLNECIELAKEFGGTDGHKYVNAVLEGLAPQLRPHEVQADRQAGRARA